MGTHSTSLLRAGQGPNARGSVAEFAGPSSEVATLTDLDRPQPALTHGLSGVLAAADELIVAPDLDTLLRRAVELARERLGLERVALFLEDEDGDHLIGTYGTDLAGRTTDERSVRFRRGAHWHEALQLPRPDGTRWTMLPDQTRYDWREDHSVPIGRGWIAYTPIRSSDGPVGVLVNDSAGSGGPMLESAQELAAVFGSLLGNVIQRKRMEQALRESEEALRQSQKLEAVGRLAGGVAHDFNNMLAVINGYSELLLETEDLDGSIRAGLLEIRKAGQRAASLTRQLLAFSRKQVLAPRVLDLNDVVANIEKMLHRLIGEDVELVTRRGAGLGQVRADPGQVEQVLLNMAVNARDAMPHGGQLTIETVNVRLDRRYARRNPGVRPGAYVALFVTDTGLGMDEATRARLFEPFFTTKELGKGTGLGLATVYGIVQQSGGHVEVESAPGAGSTFRVYLPRVDRVADQDAEEDAPASVPTGTETILLVEDEQMVRGLLDNLLQLSGYTVLEASHGGEALLLCEQHDGPIHLLVTDVVMPGMSGRELADRLSRRRPTLKVLYMSGYTDDAVLRHGLEEEGAALLQKPFNTEHLAQKVREVLG